MQLDAFAEIFADLQDPRQSAKIAYPLFDIVFLTVCAVIGGCEVTVHQPPVDSQI